MPLSALAAPPLTATGSPSKKKTTVTFTEQFVDGGLDTAQQEVLLSLLITDGKPKLWNNYSTCLK